MPGQQSRQRPNPQAEAAMLRHRQAIERARVVDDYAYDIDALLDLKLGFMASNCSMVLDVGQSTRERITLFQRQRIETMEVNRGEPLADIIDDICAPSRLEADRYDGIVCLSVLEHVYDPFAAIEHIHRLLPQGGYLFLHLPFLFRYHAPANLQFTDGYRFSRDGMAWMLRDFSEVTLYSIRGPWSSIFNLHKSWKNSLEKRFGMTPDRWLDRFAMRIRRRPTSHLQVSGYYAWARK
jgi:SAM-dependent methyltransferase